MRFQLKAGCGKHYLSLGGKDTILKPGEIVTCKKEDLGAAVDKFEALDAEAPPPNRFKIKQRAGGFFDVIHPVTGVAINSKALRKDEAERLAGKTIEQYDAELAKAAEDAEAERLAEEARLNKEKEDDAG